MNAIKFSKLANLSGIKSEVLVMGKVFISTSSRQEAGKLWRQSNKLPKLQTARGPLTDLADYSFTGSLMFLFIFKSV
jgi:hypothetical protein